MRKARESRPLKVFLCHDADDKPAVRELYARLRQDGIDPWLDEEDLLPGQLWQDEIPKAVRAADAVIVCMSQTSVAKEGYVQEEIELALSAARRKPEGTIFLIPLQLEDCDVPERLRRWQWVNLTHERGYDKLRRALRARADTLAAVQERRTQPSAPEKTVGISGTAARAFVRAVERSGQVAVARTKYEEALSWVKSFRHERGDEAKPSCFISYAWGDEAYEKWVLELAKDLRKADVEVVFDQWDSHAGDDLMRFIQRIDKENYVAAVGTPAYLEKYEDEDRDAIVSAELGLIAARLSRRPSERGVIPLLLAGTKRKSFPALFGPAVHIDFRKEPIHFAGPLLSGYKSNRINWLEIEGCGSLESMS